MIYLNKELNNNYAVDLGLFYKYRDFEDGITFWQHKIELDTYIGDHCPKFNWFLIIFNVAIFDFEIYNVNHVE